MAQKLERVVQERTEKEREFHSAGAAEAHPVPPAAERTSGTVRVAKSDERRLRLLDRA